MKIGFLSNHNPLDKNAFSSTSHFMWRALAEDARCTVHVLGSHRSPRRLVDRLWKPAPGPGLLHPSIFDGLDAVLSLASTDLVVRYGQITNVPIIHCTDATPGFLRSFYGYGVPPHAFEQERLAYENAKMILFSSDFMRERAVEEFGDPFASKMVSIPWGANLDNFPSVPPQKPPLQPLRLLFIGKDWTRKGGDIAIETLKELRRRGVAAELHVVGAGSDHVGGGGDVINHGYLNKNRYGDRLLLEDLLNRAHFLLLPTRADCTPMVLAEANSHGVPVLTTDVGGIPSLVSPGQSGEMLSSAASARDYADRLIALTGDKSEYEALSKSSFGHFMQRLTWSAWSDALLRVLAKV